jgi:YD repeat-containing protein
VTGTGGGEQKGGRPLLSVFGVGRGSVVTTTTLDGNGRVTQLLDDNNNPTLYEYDTLDRETKMTFPDGAARQYAYNEASDVTLYTDENGSVMQNTFDCLGRRTRCAATTIASGVAGHTGDGRGTTEQNFEYDGLSRVTYNDDITEVDGASAQSNETRLFYDSLGRVIEDRQKIHDTATARNATNSKFESYPLTQFTFPNGRQITNAYDAL